jgi:hypothetical protein
VFIGCAPKYIDIDKSLSEGKSVVVVPTYYVQGLRMYWGKVGNKKLYDYEKINIYYHREYEHDFPSDKNYKILAANNGTYYVSETYISISSRNYTLELPLSSADTQKFESVIGNIHVEKTPQRERINGKLEDVTSYYRMKYAFVDNDNIDSPKSIGTIAINPNEIVLIPAVWVDVEIADNSCKFRNEKQFLFEILDVITAPSTFLYDNDEETWYWNCPIKSITVNIKTKSKEDFLSEITSNPFYANKFDNVVVRNFEFGALLKQAKKIENLEDGTERYIIDGSTHKQ